MKSQAQTDSEILSSAKSADVISSEGMSLITRRHTRSVHPVTCRCSLHREIRFEPYSTMREREVVDSLDWYRED